MTPYEIVTVIIGIVGLAGGFAFGGMQLGKWISGKR